MRPLPTTHFTQVRGSRRLVYYLKNYWTSTQKAAPSEMIRCALAARNGDDGEYWNRQACSELFRGNGYAGQLCGNGKDVAKTGPVRLAPTS